MFTMHCMRLLVPVIVAEAFAATSARSAQPLTIVPYAKAVAHIWASFKAALEFWIACLGDWNHAQTFRSWHYCILSLHRLLNWLLHHLIMIDCWLTHRHHLYHLRLDSLSILRLIYHLPDWWLHKHWLLRHCPIRICRLNINSLRILLWHRCSIYWRQFSRHTLRANRCQLE